MFQEFPDDNMNDNFLSERRQKIAEQSIMNMEERKNDLKRSKSVFIGAVSGMALAGVVGWFALSPRYAAENVGEIPVIRRTQAAVSVMEKISAPLSSARSVTEKPLSVSFHSAGICNSSRMRRFHSAAWVSSFSC